MPDQREWVERGKRGRGEKERGKGIGRKTQKKGKINRKIIEKSEMKMSC